MTRVARVFGVCAALLALGGPAGAEAPAPFADFQPKMVRPPGADPAARPSPARKRITVQIDPEEQAERIAALPPMVDPQPKPAAAAAEAARPGAYTWFWDTISPELTSAGAGRLAPALRALAGSDAVAAPRLQALQEIVAEQGVAILQSTVGTSVSPALVLAVIAVESAGRADAVSSAGAAGLMQLMPDTATRFGVADRMEAAQSIKGGVKYLDWLMKEFDGDPILVLAGYNAGEGAVRNHSGVPPYAETRDYVPKVLNAFRVASGLCRTPPELISDGCVFVTMN